MREGLGERKSGGRRRREEGGIKYRGRWKGKEWKNGWLFGTWWGWKARIDNFGKV